MAMKKKNNENLVISNSSFEKKDSFYPQNEEPINENEKVRKGFSFIKKTKKNEEIIENNSILQSKFI